MSKPPPRTLFSFGFTSSSQSSQQSQPSQSLPKKATPTTKQNATPSAIGKASNGAREGHSTPSPAAAEKNGSIEPQTTSTAKPRALSSFAVKKTSKVALDLSSSHVDKAADNDVVIKSDKGCFASNERNSARHEQHQTKKRPTPSPQSKSRDVRPVRAVKRKRGAILFDDSFDASDDSGQNEEADVDGHEDEAFSASSASSSDTSDFSLSSDASVDEDDDFIEEEKSLYGAEDSPPRRTAKKARSSKGTATPSEAKHVSIDGVSDGTPRRSNQEVEIALVELKSRTPSHEETRARLLTLSQSPASSACADVAMLESSTAAARPTNSSRRFVSEIAMTTKEKSKQAKQARFEANNEQRYTWLRPEQMTDANRRRVGDPLFDPTTVYIPKSSMLKLSKFEQQFWEIKREHFDTVLFFKKGKFYELYEHDADIAKEVLGLRITDRVNMRMAGVPESHFIPWAAKLIQFGYKVGRVDQVGTAEDVKYAGGNGIVHRELAKIYTRGTLVDESLIRSSEAQHLMCIVEAPFSVAHGSAVTPEDAAHRRNCFGVCVVDSSTGLVSCGHICDDRRTTQLETVLLRFSPKEIVRIAAPAVSTDITDCALAKGHTISSALSLSAHSLQIIRRICANSQVTVLDAPWPPSEQTPALPAQDIIHLIDQRGYCIPTEFQTDNGEMHETSVHTSASSFWGLVTPQHRGRRLSAREFIQPLIGSSDDLLALRSLFLCCSYLGELKMDHEVMSQRRFASIGHYYSDLSITPVHGNVPLVLLDAHTMTNLEIVRNTLDGGSRGTLLRAIDRTFSPFGKRLLLSWVCSPLADAHALNRRLDAVEQLLDPSHASLVQQLSDLLRNMPDLERLISRIHGGYLRVPEFLGVIDAFQLFQKFVEALNAESKFWQSDLLRSLLSFEPFGLSPSLQSTLENISGRFDRKIAETQGEIVPVRGFEADFDLHSDSADTLLTELNEFLEAQKRLKLSLPKAKYVTVKGSEFLIECSVALKDQPRFLKNLPSSFHKHSSSKTMVRLVADAIQPRVRQYISHKHEVESIRSKMLHRVLATFDASARIFMLAVDCMAQLDCLLSLALASRDGFGDGGPSCRPVFIDPSISSGGWASKPVLEFTQMRHPCLASERGSEFVPNDLSLGGGFVHAEFGSTQEWEVEAGPKPHALLLTGPNMGGKSTLLRQVCVNVILAQIGCFVAAEACSLTVVDKIFTRLGANDDILAGQSTFMVELDEAARVLNQATDQSLVVLDELGRGTATVDGYSIAHAVLEHLAKRTLTRTLFSTHYHRLTAEVAREGAMDGSVQLGHMDAIVDDEARDVTFLYTLVPGVAERSYGMHVAAMAGLSESITIRAEATAEAASDVEDQMVFEDSHKATILDMLSLSSKLETVSQQFRQHLAHLLEVYGTFTNYVTTRKSVSVLGRQAPE